MRAVIVTATLTTPVVAAFGRVSFAAMLAWAQSLRLDLPSPNERPCVIDIPVARLWQSPDGLPLWGATDIYPIGNAARSVEYIHKRYPADKYPWGRKIGINLAAGQHKERRKPINTIACQTWRGAALLAEDATMADIESLLTDVTSIGAHCAAGFGRVQEWHVEEADLSPEFILARRAVPVGSRLQGAGDVRLAMAWCPPSWYTPWWAECWEGQSCF